MGNATCSVQTCRGRRPCDPSESKAANDMPIDLHSNRFSQSYTTSEVEQFKKATAAEATALCDSQWSMAQMSNRLNNARNRNGLLDFFARSDSIQTQNEKANGSSSSSSLGQPFCKVFEREAAELGALRAEAKDPHVRASRKHVFGTGAVYSGEWLGGERDGHGVQCWPDGVEYAGQWLRNVASGWGRFQKCDGDEYTGEWTHNSVTGSGVYRHSNGTTYAGQFDHDQQHGSGVEHWTDDSSFMGQFVLGKKQGHGIFMWADQSKYVGQWHDNQIHGYGQYMGCDGRTFSGTWQNSKMHGFGFYVFPDSRTFDGQYVDNQKEGFGVFTWPDGKQYEGFWQAGRQHGFGGLYLNRESQFPKMAKWNAGTCVVWIDDPGNEQQGYVPDPESGAS
mmetsp:Transcript_131347/g.262083  ORF Transcript_131347/g.262083 Transcript_131347/m.262083 type:complete len:392 (+) Transcript_131347:107-1282(+)